MSSMSKTLIRNLLLLLFTSTLLGMAMEAWLVGGGKFFIGWLVTAGLLFFSQVGLYFLWKTAGGGRILAWMVVLAFILRLGCGVALTVLLPVAGHGSADELAGHVFTDAHQRDDAAWSLAQSNTPIWAAFSQDFVADQYGGLLALSAGVYRYLSPDAHRPYLIQILAALAAAIGIPFFWRGIQKIWGDGVAKISTWIMVLYPESILLGSYQMREPFLISLIAIAFWALVTWPQQKIRTLVIFAASLIGIALFSSVVALPIVGICLLWLGVSQLSKLSSPRWKILGWFSLALIVMVMVGITWDWLYTRAHFDISGSIQNSGILQALTKSMPHRLIQPFVIAYGIAQPVLPAVLIEPAPAIWKVIGIFRSIGWYMSIPLLVYSGCVVWKVKDNHQRNQLILLVVVVWAWVVISSMRGGGDQWDNPRYRAIFLVWMALLLGWAWDWARNHQDAWLWRGFVVEGIFILVFTEWYLSRYYHFIPRPTFTLMAVIIMVLSIGFLSACWLWDHRNRLKSLP